MGIVAVRETTQGFFEIKAQILKWNQEFGKIIGRVKKNPLQLGQLNQKFKSISPQDFRSFERIKIKELSYGQRNITSKTISQQDFKIIWKLKKNQLQPDRWD